LWIKLISLGSMGTAGGRSLIAAGVIWIAMRGRRVTLTKNLILGSIFYAGTVLLFVAATKNTTAANAILLQYTAPIYVALLSYRMLGEPIRRIDWITIVVVFAGMGLFFFDALSMEGILGNLLAVASGVFFALCVIYLRREREGVSIDMVLVGNLITAAIGIPFALGSAPSTDDLVYLSLLGVVQLGLGYICFVRGVREVTAMESALIPVIEPILNPLWVALFVGELPSVYAVAGGVVVIGAITVRGVVGSRESRSQVVEESRSRGV
jgi:drug/metabolite transporter (DMT)-like permease